ncbi:MAG: alpha/beta hydrolase [Acidobacteria bacterium]|nr:MAG: alpha/beta hydrolase [Acidobacteriota bacterium]
MTTQLLFDGPPAAPLTVVLAHGAGAPMDHPWMNAVAAGLAERGLRVARFEFPYMARRRATGKGGGPDRPPVLLDAWRAVIDRLGGGDELVIGGKSMGGRIASMVADEAAVRGLVCLGYPFHPPGRPERLRTAHLADLRTPTLILQGSRDPFGNAQEVAGYELSPSIRLHWLEDGDHGFKPRRASGRTLEQNLAEAVEEIARFVGSR